MLNAFYSTKSWELPYPLLYGYADFLIVNASAIEEFCYLCGVFAAMNVFVEFAAATAPALAAKAVKTDDSWTLGFRGYMTWDSAGLDQIYARYEGDLTRLMAGFSAKTDVYSSHQTIKMENRMNVVLTTSATSASETTWKFSSLEDVVLWVRRWRVNSW